MFRLLRYAPVLAFIALFGLYSGTRSEAQTTSTATPAVVSSTPTPAPLPAGHVLIELMRKAMVAQRTVRVDETSVTRWPGHMALGWTWMDMDLQANALREIDTIQRLRPDAPSISVSVERRELVVLKGKSANRIPGGTWACERLSGVRIRNSLAAFQIPIANATTVGDTPTEGRSAWHVQVRDAPWSGGTATVDLYIAKRDRTLVRLDAAIVVHAGGTTTRDTVTDDFRRYAVPISVPLPAKCR